MKELFDPIADGIAEHGYAVVDQFLSQDEAKHIVTENVFNKTVESFKKAGIGKQEGKHINEAIRGDYIKWIDRNSTTPSVQLYLQRLNDLIQYLNESLFLSLKDYELHLTIYPPGSFYKRHLDQFKKDDHRKLSVISYLNENWEEKSGGQLRMHLTEGPLDIFPASGKLVCFRSDMIEHEVLPATRERLSITGWILDQHLELKYL
ncbi:MAG TPA: 2OG-Fe(II) oxygenase [Cyclobacteriaceae bacterium]|nr:2OG-Fe(II) oxygenase [Cyclobacteriaceae bacterium]